MRKLSRTMPLSFAGGGAAGYGGFSHPGASTTAPVRWTGAAGGGIGTAGGVCTTAVMVGAGCTGTCICTSGGGMNGGGGVASLGGGGGGGCCSGGGPVIFPVIFLSGGARPTSTIFRAPPWVNAEISTTWKKPTAASAVKGLGENLGSA